MVLIGGGSGIGLRVAHQVVAAGAEVVLGGRTAQRLAAAAPKPAVDGSVVLMSGAAGARPPVPAPAYAACNAAIEGLGRGLAVEPAPARGHPKSLEKSSSALRSVSEYQLPLSSRKIASMPMVARGSDIAVRAAPTSTNAVGDGRPEGAGGRHEGAGGRPKAPVADTHRGLRNWGTSRIGGPQGSGREGQRASAIGCGAASAPSPAALGPPFSGTSFTNRAAISTGTAITAPSRNAECVPEDTACW